MSNIYHVMAIFWWFQPAEAQDSACADRSPIISVPVGTTGFSSLRLFPYI
jgi:hypothetical protein